jgi:hypothetical protein
VLACSWHAGIVHLIVFSMEGHFIIKEVFFYWHKREIRGQFEVCPDLCTVLRTFFLQHSLENFESPFRQPLKSLLRTCGRGGLQAF